MLFLVVMLALALIPTGGACGIQNAEQSYTTYGTSDEGASLYPGAPAKCCFELAFSSHFIGSDLTYFLSMIASELVLISGSLARVIKVFRSSSAFAKEWLRHKPARISKLTVRKLEERHGQSKASLMRPVFFVFHCTVIIFIILARATYDIAESILWEVRLSNAHLRDIS
jgi:hypothetical protein